MVKELVHVFRTYIVTFRYLKKSEVNFAWMIIFMFIVWFLFNCIII